MVVGDLDLAVGEAAPQEGVLDLEARLRGPGGEDLLQLGLQVSADARHPGQRLAGAQQRRHVMAGTPQLACGIAVGEHPEGVAVAQLEQIGNFFKDAREVLVLQRCA